MFEVEKRAWKVKLIWHGGAMVGKTGQLQLKWPQELWKNDDELWIIIGCLTIWLIMENRNLELK